MESVNYRLVSLLIEKGLHISFAESCTGGMCASEIVDVPDASKVLNESLVTYSNESKEKYLKVKKETIKKYNVVSEEVAKEMAEGLFLLTNSEVCISITGLAGPTGEEKNRPIGMVCFGLKIKNEIYTFTEFFTNLGRNIVRKKAVEFIFEKTIEIINNTKEI